MITAATCFSGIGAPEVAMPTWDWQWHAELEPFPAAVMARRHPASCNFGDVLAHDFLQRAAAEPIDVLVGGPPCQAFSVAGSRGGLDDPRGNLSLRWVQIINAVRPAFSVTENVPGWLSMRDNAFGCFLGGLVGADGALPPPPGGRWPGAGMAAGPLQRACWRVLDAQYFGLAQRRKRVFVVSCPADGADPSAILFEPQGMRGDIAAGREEGAGTTVGALAGTSPDGGWRIGADEAAGGQPVAHSLRAEGFDASEDGTGRGTPIVPVAFGGNDTRGSIDVATAVNAHGGSHGRLDFESKTFAIGFNHQAAGKQTTLGATQGADSALSCSTTPAVALHENQRGELTTSSTAGALKRCGGKPGQGYPAALSDMQVRRLTPDECETLQGFPSGFTDIEFRGKPAADGNRYRALGNSMAVPVVGWILRRIEDAITGC